jgi:tetratricopeptide (TPR) repeat protein
MYAETKNEKTIAFCNALIKADTAKDKSVHPIYSKGRYYRNIGNNAEAIKIFDDCIKTDYTFSYAYLDKAEILIGEKKYTDAVKILNIAKENDNQNPDVYYLMGTCFEATNKKEDAKIEYQRAIALDKEYTIAKEALERLNK